MNGSALLAIFAIVLLAAALAVFVATRHRHPTAGTLSRETVGHDRARGSTAIPARSSGVERAGRARAAETRLGLRRKAPVVSGARAAVRWQPVDDEEIGVGRRQFLTRGALTVVGFSTATFGAAVLGFLWPTSMGGFGGKIDAGNLDAALAQIAETREPIYVPQAKAYLQPYPKDALAAAKKVYAPGIVSGMEQGVTALFQRCPHLGCRVPWCRTSQWFECPCHGSKYNRVGEKKDGPAPRGMDRFVVTIEDGAVVIDTATVFQGPPIGTNTTRQRQEGPACI